VVELCSCVRGCPRHVAFCSVGSSTVLNEKPSHRYLRTTHTEGEGGGDQHYALYVRPGQCHDVQCMANAMLLTSASCTAVWPGPRQAHGALQLRRNGAPHRFSCVNCGRSKKESGRVNAQIHRAQRRKAQSVPSKSLPSQYQHLAESAQRPTRGGQSARSNAVHSTQTVLRNWCVGTQVRDER
jgi:hypothetical protein